MRLAGYRPGKVAAAGGFGVSGMVPVKYPPLDAWGGFCEIGHGVARSVSLEYPALGRRGGAGGVPRVPRNMEEPRAEKSTPSQ